MKESILQLSQYNLWANSRLADRILTLPPEHIIQNLSSSFASLRLTMLHMWNAESVWWQRVKLKEIIDLPMETFNGSEKELVSKWKSQSQDWINWIGNSSEAAINHEFIYFDSKRNRYKQPVREVLLHLFIHQSYHRGQLVTMLHQLGGKEIPATDFIVFTRKK
ncbi:MAG: DinB family protein [Chitinophagaceae bacterium]|nr:DinB family protein [Bacteroidota bacterium]MCC6258671.1 DinB family protein [Chitinophagaceae bacterium]